jgi:hypothetical protein
LGKLSDFKNYYSGFILPTKATTIEKRDLLIVKLSNYERDLTVYYFKAIIQPT